MLGCRRQGSSLGCGKLTVAVVVFVEHLDGQSVHAGRLVEWQHAGCLFLGHAPYFIHCVVLIYGCALRRGCQRHGCYPWLIEVDASIVCVRVT